MYGNYKPETIIKNYLSPLYNSIENILGTLEIFSDWLKNPSNEKVDLILEGLSEVLAGAHEFTKSTITGMIIGERYLKVTPAVREIRKKALDILKQCCPNYDRGLRSCIEIIGLLDKIFEF